MRHCVGNNQSGGVVTWRANAGNAVGKLDLMCCNREEEEEES